MIAYWGVESYFLYILPWLREPGYQYTSMHTGFTAIVLAFYIAGALGGMIVGAAVGRFSARPRENMTGVILTPPPDHCLNGRPGLPRKPRAPVLVSPVDLLSGGPQHRAEPVFGTLVQTIVPADHSLDRRNLSLSSAFHLRRSRSQTHPFIRHRFVPALRGRSSPALFLDPFAPACEPAMFSRSPRSRR